ncbi:MAG: glycosyltransferase [Gammaproteobacteria bacterium]|nr:glycosyltransferase [Gammaproteobacteria bacterium]
MLQSGLLGPSDSVDFGWTESLSAELVAVAVQEHCTVYGQNPVVVYGAGAHTTQYWSAISQLNVVAIADKNPALWGSRVKGFEVIRPTDIPQFAAHVLISSRAFESNIARELAISLPQVQLLKIYAGRLEQQLQVWADQLAARVLAFQPDLLVHTPTHVTENLPASFFLQLKQQLPQLKIVTVWWDYDEENSAAGYLDYERAVLTYADLVIENSNASRLTRLHRNEPPYQHHPNPERVIFHPTWFDPSLFYPISQAERDIDVAVFGSRVGERGDWIDLLAAEFGERFKHIGGVSGEQRNPLPIGQYAAMLRRTKIVVNTQTYSFRQQCKGKVREAIQCGVLLMEQENTETRQLLPDGCGVVYFRTPSELMSQIRYYLAEQVAYEKNQHAAVNLFAGQSIVKNWTDRILRLLDRTDG